jgi:uncharacterized membrane protein YkvA (DUF1232 family)
MDENTNRSLIVLGNDNENRVEAAIGVHNDDYHDDTEHVHNEATTNSKNKSRDDFYHQLRERMRLWLATDEGKNYKFAEFLMLGPDFFHLMCRLVIDSGTPIKEKAKLAAAIAYFVAPMDFLPELLTGPVGYLDDIGVAALVLNSIVNKSDQSIVKKHWAGQGNVLELVQGIIQSADQMLGGGLWGRIKRRFGKSDRK